MNKASLLYNNKSHRLQRILALMISCKLQIISTSSIYIEGGGESFRTGDSDISTKFMGLRVVIQYINCLQFLLNLSAFLKKPPHYILLFKELFIQGRDKDFRLTGEVLLFSPVITSVLSVIVLWIVIHQTLRSKNWVLWWVLGCKINST